MAGCRQIEHQRNGEDHAHAQDPGGSGSTATAHLPSLPASQERCLGLLRLKNSVTAWTRPAAAIHRPGKVQQRRR